MDVAKFKQVFDTLDDEGQRNVLSKLTDAELDAVMSYSGTPRVEPAQDSSMNPVLETITNIPGSAAKFAGNIASAVMHPIDTATGLGTLAAGAIDLGARKLEQAVPESMRNAISGLGGSAQAAKGWEPGRNAVSSVGQFYADRYGGLDKTGRTIVTDPVGVMADASAILGIGSGALRMAGLNNASSAALRASNAINPINVAIKAANKTVVPAVKHAYSAALGQTTGSGKFAIDEAIKGSPEFIKAMRGATSDDAMVAQAHDAVSRLKQARTVAYEDTLSNLKGSTTQIDISGIKNAADGLLKRFKIGNTQKGLDFSRSTIADKAAQDVVRTLYDDVQSWGTRAGDKTVIGLDTLKRRIGDLYTPNGNARAMVASLRDNINSTINSKFPEYSKLTGDYAKATKTIKDVEKSLSLGTQASVDTAATKLITAIRKDNEFRRALMATLDTETGQNIIPIASGRALSNAWSNRLGSYATQAAAGGAAIAMSNPAIALIMASASPRLAGELSVLLGRVSRAVGKTIRTSAPAAVPLEQAGKITDSIEQTRN